MNSKQLCQWLRDNSSGVYRPSAEAAERIEELERKVCGLQTELFNTYYYEASKQGADHVAAKEYAEKRVSAT